MNPYIGEEDCFARLLDREEFMSHPILPLVADMVLEMGNIDKKGISSERKNKIEKSIKKKKDYIKAVLKEPAYRFNDSFSLEK